MSAPENDDLQFIILKMAGLANMLDHALSQIDSLRSQLNTLTRKVEGDKLVLGDGKIIYLRGE